MENNWLWITAAKIKASASDEIMFYYTLPSMVDGCTVTCSYHQEEQLVLLLMQLAYTGVEGLSVMVC